MTQEISQEHHEGWGTTPGYLESLRRSYLPQQIRIPEIRELSAEEIRASRERAIAEQAGPAAVAQAAEVTAE